MTSISSPTLVALTLSTFLVGPSLAQQQGGQQGQQGSQQTQQQFGQQGQRSQQVAQQYRQEQGRVVQVRPSRVRGVNTPNYLVVIETRPGRRIVADIGQNRRGQNLQQGTPVAVRGQVVRVGDRGALLLADAVRVDNQTYHVNRPAYRPTGTSSRQVGAASGGNRLQERAALRRQLRQVGFKNIQVLDTAFLVRASTPDGRTVLMMVDPPQAALLGVTSSPGQQNRSSTGQGQNQSGQNSMQGGSTNQGGSTGSGG